MDLSSGLACGVSGQQLRLDLSPAVCSMPLSYVPTATYRFNLAGELLEFADGTLGLALNLETQTVGVVRFAKTMGDMTDTP